MIMPGLEELRRQQEESHPLALGDELNINNSNNNDEDHNDPEVPLRRKILNVIKSCPNHTIRPAQLSQALGLSVNDANAELCGLLQVVGPTATFEFQEKEMVFSFPPNVEQKAWMAETKQDVWEWLYYQVLPLVWKGIQMVTAFGILLSTLIIFLAMVVAMVAALVAMSRGDQHQQRHVRHLLSRQSYNMINTLRQLLWCYAMFGPSPDYDNNEQQHSGGDLRQAAYDSWLCLSLWFGNPSSIFFWMRARQYQQRRHRMARGWGHQQQQPHHSSSWYNPTTTTSTTTTVSPSSSELEGIALMRRRNNNNGTEERIVIPSNAAHSSMEHRGFLSLVVEFLFGPNHNPNLKEADQWRMKSWILMEHLQNVKKQQQQQQQQQQHAHVALQELMPFANVPPPPPPRSSTTSTLQDNVVNHHAILSQGLPMISHFNGIPSPFVSSSSSSWTYFIFPEFLSEGPTSSSSTTILPASFMAKHVGLVKKQQQQQQSKIPFVLYEQDNDEDENDNADNHNNNDDDDGDKVGNHHPYEYYWKEPYQRLTHLTKGQFLQVAVVGFGNLMGVLWLGQALQEGPNGILYQTLSKSTPKLYAMMQTVIFPMLWFYAQWFGMLPFLRYLFILVNNHYCHQRNQRRAAWARTLLLSLEDDNNNNNNNNDNNGNAADKMMMMMMNSHHSSMMMTTTTATTKTTDGTTTEPTTTTTTLT